MSAEDFNEKIQVFISHSSIDKPFVRMIASDIEAFGLLAWVDELELNVGDILMDRISAAIHSASCIIACLSPNSLQSQWVQKEIAIGVGVNMNGHPLRVIPALCGDIVDAEIPAPLQGRLYADFRVPE